MTSVPDAIAFIPARSGSKRVPGKNVRVLKGHPLIAYTIAAAQQSGVFRAVVVSTDSEATAEIARHYGAEVPCLRPAEIAGDLAPDIRWVDHLLRVLADAGRTYDCFSILRPTSPFRSAQTIQRAWREFVSDPGIDSLRAVELCKQHPGKMWVLRGQRMLPLLPLAPAAEPWHSSQYQALPQVYVQNASLEIAYCRVALEQGTIAGVTMRPFLTEGNEGFDINQPRDWDLAEWLIDRGGASLPSVSRAPYVCKN
jgi:CMP-N,N'-diacetyllegionaminic acid synthase